MSEWSKQWDAVCARTEDPVQRIVDLALAEYNTSRGSVFLTGDQGPANPTLEQLQRAGSKLVRQGLGLHIAFGSMMGPCMYAMALQNSITSLVEDMKKALAEAKSPEEACFVPPRGTAVGDLVEAIRRFNEGRISEDWQAMGSLEPHAVIRFRPLIP